MSSDPLGWSGKDLDRIRMLGTIIAECAPELLPAVGRLRQRSLEPADRSRLEEALANALVEHGLTIDDEPTQRGLLIEDLLGWLDR